MLGNVLGSVVGEFDGVILGEYTLGMGVVLLGVERIEGMKDGETLGFNVGQADGDSEGGACKGWKLGFSDGSSLETTVSRCDGATDGSTLSEPEGINEETTGCMLGAAAVRKVGVSVGMSSGASLGTTEG